MTDNPERGHRLDAFIRHRRGLLFPQRFIEKFEASFVRSSDD